LLVVVPYYLKTTVGGGLKTWVFFFALTALPILIGFWHASGTFSPRKNEKAQIPGKPIEHYLTFKTPELKEKYFGKTKIPMETFHEAYFNQEVDFNGDCLDAMEYRHDWAQFRLTWGNYWFFLTGMIPEVILHTRSQGTFTSLFKSFANSRRRGAGSRSL
jgi:hypothetical protein